MAKRAEVTEVTPPNMEVIHATIRGTAPYVQNKFSKKARDEIAATQRAGSTAKKGKKHAARDFESDYEQAKHVSEEGWVGIPAPAFRSAMIDACRMVGFHMTKARMSVFVLHDSVDAIDGTPLVRIDGDCLPFAEDLIMPVRNKSGVVDLRARPRWNDWSANLRLRYDADQFTSEDVCNLLLRAGVQCGVGEGRPFSKDSNGMGWGTFEIYGDIKIERSKR